MSPVALTTGSEGDSPEVAARSLFASASPDSDNAPTVISRTRPKSIRSEDGFPNDVRGRRLAHFELIEPIGVGGMAAVIRARDTQLDRTVALKILPPEMAANPENILRFHQEARAAAKLDHENIARVFFCGEDQGLHFISFEFVEGETLRALVERRGVLPVAETINYLLQIATGLAHAGERGVVHRDIKPSNIIITPNGRAKLVDMGLARSLATHGDIALTQSGVTLGTFDYISPEQALEPRDADVRSDIYSLGCTFYHVLTGHAPVPEGTAAKKLHHHQNIGPVDPRQLNPQIPDEVAGILARMMAKDPKDRYQRPEHLVQHLLLQAHKLGAVPELPNGVLFVDTPLPSPPRFRPAWMLTAAVFLLLAFVVIQQMLSRPERPSRLASWKEAKQGLGQEQVKLNANPPDGENHEKKGSPLPQAPTNVPQEVHNARELVAALERSEPTLDLRLAVELIDLNQERDLWGGGTPGLTFAGDGRKLVIQPKNPAQRPTIKLTYNADLPAASVWSAFTVRGGEVILRHLRFAVDATEAPGIRMAALRLQEGGQLTLEDCEFEQVGAPSTGQLSSVLVEGIRGDTLLAKLVMSECYFGGQERNSAPVVLGGQDAITLDGPAVVQMRSCAFAPHAAMVHFIKGVSGGKATVEIRQTSALMTEGAAFLFEKGVAGNIRLHQSLFSCPNNRTTMLEAALVHQKGGAPATDLSFVSRGNCYHSLDDFWIVDGQSQHKDWPNEDQVLRTSPWLAKDPLAALKEGNPKEAFQIDLQKAELHLEDRLVGVQRCTWGPMDANAATGSPEPKKTEVAGTLVVDPTVIKAGRGTYPSLDGAVADAKSGDTILLKHNGLLKVDMIRLEKPDVDLTIRPFEGHHPILTLGQSSDPEAGMFRLHDGKLRLKDLEFLIASDPADFQSRAVVTVVGDGECVMSNCLATLDKGDNNPDRDLALLTILDTTNVMKMQPQAPRASPEIRLENCFVRGKGELLAVRSSRPFRLQADRSLVVLDGNFLEVKGSARDVRIDPAAQVTLSHVTAYLTSHLIWLRGLEREGNTGKGLVQTQITSATDCLFAAAAGRSLIHLDGIEQNSETKYFSWTENRNNAFSRYQRFLDQQAPKEEVMDPPPYDRMKWDGFTTSVRPRYDSVRFASAPPFESSLSNVMPSDFKVIPDGGSDLQEYGAVIKELPVPREAQPPTDK